MGRGSDYTCGYPHCLHHGTKVLSSEAVVDGNKRYHWDCAVTKEQISQLRKYYKENVDDKVNFGQLSKVLNSLIFDEGLDIDYIEYALEYFVKCNIKIKSPFTLTYLNKNDSMKRRWAKNKQVVTNNLN